MCKELRIKKHEYYIYHKNHIEKVIAVAITAYAFDGSLDSRGDGLEIVIYQLQAARLAKKEHQQREMPTACSNVMSLFYTKKEAAILLMLNATGSVEGTSDKPKFALRSIVEKKNSSELLNPLILEENTLAAFP
jgi:hypothetical protein